MPDNKNMYHVSFDDGTSGDVTYEQLQSSADSLRQYKGNYEILGPNDGKSKSYRVSFDDGTSGDVTADQLAASQPKLDSYAGAYNVNSVYNNVDDIFGAPEAQPQAPAASAAKQQFGLGQYGPMAVPGEMEEQPAKPAPEPKPDFSGLNREGYRKAQGEYENAQTRVADINSQRDSLKAQAEAINADIDKLLAPYVVTDEMGNVSYSPLSQTVYDAVQDKLAEIESLRAQDGELANEIVSLGDAMKGNPVYASQAAASRLMQINSQLRELRKERKQADHKDNIDRLISSLKNEKKSLQKELAANPATEMSYQESSEHIDSLLRQAQDVRASMGRNNEGDNEPMLNEFTPNPKFNAEDYRNDTDMYIIEGLYAKAKEELAKPQKYGDETAVEKFAEGAIAKAKDPDFWALGLQGVEQQQRVIDIYRKMEAGEDLNPMEEKVLEAYNVYQWNRLMRSIDTSTMYKGGEMSMDMAKLALEMMATGALGGQAISDALKSRLMKTGVMRALIAATPSTALGKAGVFAAKEGMEWVISGASDLFGRTLVYVAETPDALVSASEMMAPDTEGNMMSAGKAIAKSYGIETANMYFLNSSAKLMRAFTDAARVAGYATESEAVNAWYRDFVKMQHRAGTAANSATFALHSVLGPYGMLKGAAFDQLTKLDPEALDNFLEKENMGALMLSLIPGMVKGAAKQMKNTYEWNRRMAWADKNLNDTVNRALVDLYSLPGMNVEQTKAVIDMIRSSRIKPGSEVRDVDSLIKSISKSLLEGGNVELAGALKGLNDVAKANRWTPAEHQEAMKAIYQVMEATRVYQMFDGEWKGNQERLRDEKQAEISERLGGRQYWYDVKRGGLDERLVSVARDAEGREVFVVNPDKADGQLDMTGSGRKVAVISEDGSGIRFVNMSELEGMRTMPLRGYLEARVVRDIQESETLYAEDQKAAVAEQYKVGDELEVPSAYGAEPERALVVSKGADGVTITRSDGTEKKMAWDEAAAVKGEAMRTEQQQATEDGIADAMAESDRMLAEKDLNNDVAVVAEAGELPVQDVAEAHVKEGSYNPQDGSVMVSGTLKDGREFGFQTQVEKLQDAAEEARSMQEIPAEPVPAEAPKPASDIRPSVEPRNIRSLTPAQEKHAELRGYGLTPEEVSQNIEANLAQAKRNVEELRAQTPAMGTDAAEFVKQRDAHNAQLAAADAEVKMWESIRNYEKMDARDEKRRSPEAIEKLRGRIDALESERGIHAHIVTMKDYRQVLSETLPSGTPEEKRALAKAIRQMDAMVDAVMAARWKGKNVGVNGFEVGGKVFILAEFNDKDSTLNSAYKHETQHVHNKEDKTAIDAIVNVVGDTPAGREALEQIVSRLAGMPEGKANPYIGRNIEYLADELTAFALETGAPNVSRLAAAGASKEIIDVLNKEYGRQQSGNYWTAAGRNAYDNADGAGSGRADGTNPSGEPAGVGGQGLRPVSGSNEQTVSAEETVARKSAEALSQMQSPEGQLSRQVTEGLSGSIESGEGKTEPIHYSASAILEGTGLTALAVDESGERKSPIIVDGNLIAILPDGTRIDGNHPVTGEMLSGIKNSALRYMMNDALRVGTVKPENEARMWDTYASMVNAILKKGLKENGGFTNLDKQWQWLGETVYKTVASNSDKQYSWSLDITRVCKKNEAVIKSIAEYQKRLGYGITPGQIMDIYLESNLQGYQVPCPVCYVFSRYINNGKYATIMINGQKKYGDRLVDPSTLTENEKAEKVEMWLELLEEVKAENERNAKSITSAKNAMKYSLATIDKIGRQIMEGGMTEAEVERAKERMRVLDARYRAALNVVSQSGLDGWITKFAIKKSSKDGVESWELYDDTWQGFPEDVALDLRKTNIAITDYPAIQRYRNSRGAGAGKEITFAADNGVGEVAMMLGKGPTPNYYKMAVEAADEKERAAFLAQASKRFDSAHKYAVQQSLRGGQRMWSWSDNIERLSPDVFTNLFTMEILGGALQSYSKQLEGIKLVATMDGYVNGSLMGKGIGYREIGADEIDNVGGQLYLKGGDFIGAAPGEKPVFLKSPVYERDGKYYTLEFDKVVGIDPFGEPAEDGHHLKGLFELNETLDRAGNILVGMNDIHIRTAMADGRVYFIIPWHSSGNDVHILKQMLSYLDVDLNNFKPQDYTNVQEEKTVTKVSTRLRKVWESHRNETDFICGIDGGIPSGNGAELSDQQVQYKRIRDAIFVGEERNGETVPVEQIPEYMDVIFNKDGSPKDAFLSQVYDKVRANEFGEMTKEDCNHIYPYEYWDEKSTYWTADVNGDRYIEYCRRLGYKPKFCGTLSGKKDFGNFVDDPGYWKLLIDRRMYDTRGNFQDLTPVTSERFTPDIIDPEKTAQEFKVTRVADDEGTNAIVDNVMQKEANLMAPAGVENDIPMADYGTNLTAAVEQFKKASDDFNRFSKSMNKAEKESFNLNWRVTAAQDAEYMDAVNAGDMDKAQQMVDEVAKDAGYTIDAYHGTPNGGFTTFKPSKADSQFGDYKFGNAEVTYFTSSEEAAKTFAGWKKDKQVYHVKVKMDNPYVVNNTSDAKNKSSFNIKDDDLRKVELSMLDDLDFEFNGELLTEDNIEYFKKALFPFNMGLKKMSDTDYDVIQYGNNSMFGSDRYVTNVELDTFIPQDVISDIREQVEGDDENDYLYSTDHVARIVLAMNDVMGTRHDGVIVKDIFDAADMFVPSGDDYITFVPAQAKSADPVTYDNEGNVIPLSQRFNPAEDDIRFSVIGERGVANDNSYEGVERRNNLDVAKQMDQELGPDWNSRDDEKALRIKAATGWERGADGLWRYEVGEGTLRENPKLERKEWEVDGDKRYEYVGTLNDVYDAPELYRVYPFLKDLTMEVNPYSEGEQAFFSYPAELIKVVSKYTRWVEPEHSERYKELEEKLEAAFNAAVAEGKDLLVANDEWEATEEGKELKELAEKEKGRFEAGFAGYEKKGLEKSIAHEIQHAIQYYEGFARGSYFGPNYKVMGGEVEARNVEARLLMTPEQRRKSLLASTEDVDRKNQILRGAGKQEDYGVSFRATEISPEVRDEMEVIKANAFVDGTFMKGKDGKTDTKLSEEQWLAVRTNNFKQWFGDWENDPENASKVVDPETGEPLVVYHGTNWKMLEESVGNAVFQKDDSGVGYHFGDNKSQARDRGSDTYSFFLDIRKPYDVMDGDWSLAHMLLHSVSNRGEVISPMTNEDFVSICSSLLGRSVQEEEIPALIEQLEDFSSDLYRAAEQSDPKPWLDVIKRDGYDGLVYFNMGEGEPTMGKDDNYAYVAFDANRIKSATDNTGAFSEQDDIRFSVTPQQDKDFKNAVKSGDIAKAQEMLDAVAEAAGYKIKAFHGTNAVFNRFDPEKLGSKNWLAPSAAMGFFASKSKETAESYTGLNSMDTMSLHFNKEAQDNMERIKKDFGYDEAEKREEENRTAFEEKFKAEHNYKEEVEDMVDLLKERYRNDEWIKSKVDNVDEYIEEASEDWKRSLASSWNRKVEEGQELDRINQMNFEYNETPEHKAFADFQQKVYDAWEQTEIERLGYVPNVKSLYVKLENPLVHDFKGEGRDVESFAARMAKAKDEGRDGCIFLNVADGAEIDDIYAVFDNTQFKSADVATYDDNGNLIPLSQRFDASKDDIRFSVSNENQQVFVSNALSAVEAMNTGKATPQQWLGMLTSKGGLKAAEDKWLGLSDWLSSSDRKTLTKDEVLGFIRENQIQIEEVKYDMDDNKPLQEMDKKYPGFSKAFLVDGVDDANLELYVNDEAEARRIYESVHGASSANNLLEEELVDFAFDEMRKERDNLSRPINGTRVDYTTNGLRNQREIALTVPTIEPWNKGDMVHFGDAGEGRAVAWIRFGETEADGKRVLVIDEIQSKRHQEGRDKGYRQPFDERLAELGYTFEKEDRHWVIRDKDGYSKGSVAISMVPDEKEAKQTLSHVLYPINSNNSIPAAPFEKNWHELAMKRMLRLAAEEGYDKVAWTNGSMQAERYSLKKVMDAISYKKDDIGLYSITCYKGKPEEGVIVYSDKEITEDKLPEIVGADLAKQIINDGGEGFGSRKVIRLDESVERGGEGMKGFYDDILPRFMNKYGKKWGAKVEDITLPGLGSEDGWHSVDVTDAMKESVMGGQVMFRTTEIPTEVSNPSDFSSATGEEMMGAWGNLPADIKDEVTDKAMSYGGDFSSAVEEKLREIESKGRLTAEDNAVLEAAARGIADAMQPLEISHFSVFDAERENIHGEQIDQAVEKIKAEGLKPAMENLYDDMIDEVRADLNPDMTDDEVALYLSDIAEQENLNDTEKAHIAIAQGYLERAYDFFMDTDDARWMLYNNIHRNDTSVMDRAHSIAVGRAFGFGQPAYSQGEMQIKQYLEEAAKARTDLIDSYRAMRKVTDYMTEVGKAMAMRKEYDKETIDKVVNLSRMLLDSKLMDSMSNYQVRRLVSTIRNSATRRDIAPPLNKLFSLVLDNQLARVNRTFDRVLKVKGEKVDSKGVVVQGRLDIEGNRIFKSFRDYYKSDIATMTMRLAELSNQMSSRDPVVAAQATSEYAGASLASEYREKVQGSKDEEKQLRSDMEQANKDHKDGKMDNKSYKEFKASSEAAIRENRQERLEALMDITQRLMDISSASRSKAVEFAMKEADRISDIHHNANSDMEGLSADIDEGKNGPSVQQMISNAGLMRFFLSPLNTLDQMFRMIGSKSVNGEGYLYNRFVRGQIDCAGNEYMGLQECFKTLDDKVSDVFGKKMKWSDLYDIEKKMPVAHVTWGPDGTDHVLTQGNMLYIYMVDKMNDGQMKLRKMNIDESDVDAITKALDPRFIQLADWVQDEFLPARRVLYNEVYERMFGASMSAIENYFPLRVNKDAVVTEEDISSQGVAETSPSTITGNLIKRTRNSKPLDILGSDAFSVVIEHVQKMEHWRAFAEWNRDISTLISYNRFRTQMKNMDSTLYGAGDKLWENFKAVCAIGAGEYKPKGRTEVDKAFMDMAKGVTAAKISLRMFTAFKQVTSFPAYFSEANVLYLGQSLANPVKAWNWSMENLPLFKKRWKSRQAGDHILSTADKGFFGWRSDMSEAAARVGMTPNAFIDAMTVSMGAYAIYKTKFDNYRKMGFAEAEADRKAKQDAQILYNETQQSNEAAFMSPMQLDRSVATASLTVFRNSAMGYERQLVDALRNMKRRFTPGFKGQSLEFMGKQLMRQGLSESAAEKAAKRLYERQVFKDAVRIGIFGYVLQLCWYLSSYLPYLIFGKDDDSKEEMVSDAQRHAMFGGVEGLTFGSGISEAGNLLASGEGLSNFDFTLLPILSDIQSVSGKFEKDWVAGVNDIVNLAVQVGVGVNPQTLTDMAVAVYDACGGDLPTGREALILWMRLMQFPQSQIEQIYLDDIQMSAAEAKDLTIDELASRYARYKALRGAPLTFWNYDDNMYEKVMDKYKKRIVTGAKERLTGLDKYEEVAEQSAKLTKEVSELKKKAEAGGEESARRLGDIMSSPEYQRVMLFDKVKKAINDEAKKAVEAKTLEEMSAHLDAVETLTSQFGDSMADQDAMTEYLEER